MGFVLAALVSQAAVAGWQAVGNLPGAGSSRDFFVDSADATHVATIGICGPSGCLLESKDGGISWKWRLVPLIAGLDAATGHVYNDSGSGGGGEVSADFGRSFQPLAALPRAIETAGGIIYSKQSVMFASPLSASAVLLRRSADAGRTFSGITAGLPDGNTNELDRLFTPSPNSSVLYARVLTADSTVGSATYKLYRSVDGGVSWQAAGGGLPKLNGFLDGPFFEPGNDRVVYLNTGSGFYRSADAGLNWSWYSALDAGNATTRETLVFTNIGSFGAGQATVLLQDGPVSSLSIDPGNSQNALATTAKGVFRSQDGGRTWAAASSGLPAGLKGKRIYRLRDGKALLHGCGALQEPCAGNGALYRSIDNGLSWQLAPDNGLVDAASVVGSGGSRLYLANFEKLVASSDGGNSFQRIDQNMPSSLIGGLLALPGGSTVLATGNGSVLRSEDGGRTWQRSDNGLLGTSYLFSPRYDKASGSIWLAYGGSLYQSGDAGKSWTLRYSGRDFTSVAISTASPNVLMAHNGRSSDTLESAVSTDGGRSWRKAAPPPQRSTDLEPSSNDANRWFATASFGLTSSDCLYETTDLAQSWKAVAGGLPTASAGEVMQCRGLATDPLSPNVLYLGVRTTQRGGIAGRVYKSNDRGTSWTPTAEFPRTGGTIRTLSFDVNDNRSLYAAANNGVFKTSDGGATWQELGRAGIEGSFFSPIFSAAGVPGKLGEVLAGGLNGLFRYRPDQLGASVQASGVLQARALTAAFAPAVADEGKTGHVFIAAALPNGAFYLRGATAWLPLDRPVAYSSGPLRETLDMPLLSTLDVRSLEGTVIYVGYGVGATATASFADMVAKGSYLAAYRLE